MSLQVTTYNFGLKDLAMIFQVELQSAGDVFNTWIDHMYWKFDQLSIWPHRELILRNMPVDFKSDFKTTLVIIDCNE